MLRYLEDITKIGSENTEKSFNYLVTANTKYVNRGTLNSVTKKLTS